MSPEIAGQRTSGTRMSERDCFLGAVEHLRGASACIRGIALLRGDQRWLLPVRVLDEVTERVTKLMTRRGASLLILPRRMGE